LQDVLVAGFEIVDIKKEGIRCDISSQKYCLIPALWGLLIHFKRLLDMSGDKS